MATPQNIGAPAPNANKISIVTKSEIRYEGILYHINPQDQNITLCNVKSFGTEGRRPGDEIGPSPQMHEYIIFRGSDIKDLKVIETAQTQPEAPTQNEKPLEHSAPKEQIRSEEKDIKMGKEGNQEDFDFQAMKEKFHQFTLDHKQPELNSKAYAQKDFFDSLSTSTGEKTREIPFDRVAQKKVDKETFGSEYVDNATTRGRGGYRRGGYRGGGGQNRRYGGNQGNRNYGGQNYGGQNRYQNRGGYDNQEGGHGGQGGYGGHGGQGGYGGQNRYQNRGGYDNQEGGHGGQGGYRGQGGHGGQGGYGGQNRYQNRGGYDNQEGGHGGQGGYGNQGGYGGHGGQGGYNQGGRGGKYQNQSGPRYYKTYQTVSHDQDNQQQQGNEEGFKKYEQGNDEGFRKY